MFLKYVVTWFCKNRSHDFAWRTLMFFFRNTTALTIVVTICFGLYFEKICMSRIILCIPVNAAAFFSGIQKLNQTSTLNKNLSVIDVLSSPFAIKKTFTELPEMNWDRLHKITTSRNLFQSHSCKAVSKASCFLSISVWGVLKFRYPQVPIPWLLW